MRDFSDAAGIPARGAALMEQDRRLKTRLFAVVLLLYLGIAYRFYKQVLAISALVFVGTRPPVKRALNRAAALLRRDGA